nr:hypothetical protein [Vibrio vulnificus]
MNYKNSLPLLGKVAIAVAASISFSTWADTYNEAPQLKELVAAGKLPPNYRQ